MKDLKEYCLAVINPELAKEWDYERNYPLTPHDVFPNTHQFVYWKCDCGFSWNAQVQRRNDGYCKCKKCNKRGSSHKPKTKEEFYSKCLAVINPELAKEWNIEKNYPLTPYDVLCRGKKEYWWKCTVCDYEWKNRIDHRGSGYGNCVRCNSLAVKRPDLLDEWDYEANKGIDPYQINYHSIQIVGWKCKGKGHKWESNVDNRTRKSFTPGCPYCSIPPKRVCIDNCLATVNPELSKEWHPTKNGKITPYDVTAFSNIMAWWICKNDHIWKACLNNRANGNGCPKCSGINLKNGVHCASIPEAYMYLQYKKQKLKFVHNKKYGGSFGARRYDFYFPDENKYVEVTSYNEDAIRYWDVYHANILKKKEYVENVLKAKFEFIQFMPTSKQIAYVRKNTKKSSK